MPKPHIAITVGDPAGIGPDITLQCLQSNFAADITLLTDKEVLGTRAAQLGLRLPDHIHIKHFPFTAPVVCGQANPEHAQTLLNTLSDASRGCLEGDYDAVVTGPLNKQVINEAGFAFSGHTEFFAEKTQTDTVVMMLACSAMRVALVTTHCPLSAVPEKITHEHLRRVITIVKHDLQHKFAIKTPRIAVTGLNPHAGEGGYLGREEIDVITPVIQSFQAQGDAITGPWPADTVFTPKHLEQCDVVLAMYHDQGLPVLKYAGFGDAANITLGLPIIRTSVDHGTAYDLAGSGRAHSGSLATALNCAIDMANRQNGQHT